MNAIELRGLRKHYPEFSLKDLDLTLPSGCILGLIGENGAGKSTTLRMVLGITAPDAGTVSVLGRDSYQYPSVREDIGAVPDEIGLPDCITPRQLDRILANTYLNWDSAMFYEYLKRLSLPERKAFSSFSKGMKMKLGIAAALSHHPRLLLLDEATSGLDPVVRDEVIDLFSDFTREEDHSVLISSHIVSDLEKICDYIAFLHKGRLLLCEEKDRLLEEYVMIRCSPEQLAGLPILGKRESSYGAEALIRRENLPRGIAAGKVNLEELFVFMVKGEEQ